MVRPTPAEARLTPNAPCQRVEREPPVNVCAFGAPAADATTTVALVGDSHAAHWRAALDVVARHKGWHGASITLAGCPLSAATKRLPGALSASCARWKAGVHEWLTAHPEVSVVVVSQTVSRRGVLPDPGKTTFETEVDGYADAWAALPPSVKRVLVIRDNPHLGQQALGCVERAMRAERDPGRRCSVARGIALERDPAAVAASRRRGERVHLVDLSRFFCDRRRCYPVIGGALVYKDGHHLTRVYAATLGPVLLRGVERLEAASAAMPWRASRR